MIKPITDKNKVAKQIPVTISTTPVTLDNIPKDFNLKIPTPKGIIITPMVKALETKIKEKNPSSVFMDIISDIPKTMLITIIKKAMISIK